jgi:Mycothiol maleylpyruvate isomerase N-terminal domain
MADTESLLDAEEAAWHELRAELERLTDEEMERPGITPDGWSVKDVMFHIGAWAAECGLQLERMRMGTWKDPHDDVERRNREWFELSRSMDLKTVRSEFVAARTRMVVEFGTMPEITPPAVEWFEESGPLHYGEHLVDLRRWCR